MEAAQGLEARIRAFYDLFNARDIDGCLANMTADVNWHNAMENEREIGQDAIREYWTRQFTMIQSTVTPVRIEVAASDDPGRATVTVTVDQVVRTLDGEVRSHNTVLHRYELRDGLVSRMDALPAP